MTRSQSFTGRFESIGLQPALLWAIVDFSSITEFALSGNLVVKLAQQEPCIPDGTSRSRVIVAPKTRVFDLAHAFQILVEKHGRS